MLRAPVVAHATKAPSQAAPNATKNPPSPVKQRSSCAICGARNDDHCHDANASQAALSTHVHCQLLSLIQPLPSAVRTECTV